LEGALRIAHLRGSSNDAFSQHWVSPTRSANEDENAAVMVVVAVEWTKSKAHSSTEITFFNWKTKQTLFKGEYYVIRAKTAKAKPLFGGYKLLDPYESCTIREFKTISVPSLNRM
jgi:hypothetical protein